MMYKICEYCKEEFYIKRPSEYNRRKCCSIECSSKNRSKHIKICSVCGKEFKKPTKTCSVKCAGKLQSKQYKLNKIKKICIICGKEFYKHRKTCSVKCGKKLKVITYRDTMMSKYGVINCSQLENVKHKKSIKGYWFLTPEGRKQSILNNKKRGHEKIHKICGYKKCKKEFIVAYGFRKQIFCSVQCRFLHGQRDTKPEKLVKNILNMLNIKYEFQFTLKNKIYDFGFADIKLIIEVDGTYWHSKNINFNEMKKWQKKIYLNDKLKNEIAIQNGYKIIRVWDDEISNKYMRKILYEYYDKNGNIKS